METLSGQRPTDLHRHVIDPITWPCAGCDGVMSRIPEVLDCWFESGSMPYGMNHYPFENTERFEATFPAKFIAEGLDQTRGWFYTLIVLSTALFDRPGLRELRGQRPDPGRGRPQDVEEPEELPGPLRDLRSTTGPMPSEHSSSTPRCSGPSRSASARTASPRWCGRFSCRCGTPTASSPPTPRPTGSPIADLGAAPPGRSRPEMDRWILSVLAEPGRRGQHPDGGLLPVQRGAPDPRVHRPSHQLVRATDRGADSGGHGASPASATATSWRPSPPSMRS